MEILLLAFLEALEEAGKRDKKEYRLQCYKDEDGDFVWGVTDDSATYIADAYSQHCYASMKDTAQEWLQTRKCQTAEQALRNLVTK